jgi:hypothetical protein
MKLRARGAAVQGDDHGAAAVRLSLDDDDAYDPPAASR